MHISDKIRNDGFCRRLSTHKPDTKFVKTFMKFHLVWCLSFSQVVNRRENNSLLIKNVKQYHFFQSLSSFCEIELENAYLTPNSINK